MSDTLTPEQTKQRTELLHKWIDIICATDRIDPVKAYDIVTDIREKLLVDDNENPLKPCPVVIVDNPIEAWVACNLFHDHGVHYKDLKAELAKFFSLPEKDRPSISSFSSPSICGSLDGHVFGAHEFYTKVFGGTTPYDSQFEIWEKSKCLGFVYILDDIVIISEKPKTYKVNKRVDADGVPDPCLHCSDGPTVEFHGFDADKIKAYYLNGVMVPDWVVETDEEHMPIERYKELSTADQKAEFLRKVGIDRMITLGKRLDGWDNPEYKDEIMWAKSEYELYDMAEIFVGIDYAPHLKMKNQTTGIWHLEGVDPSCKTLREAIAFRLNDPNGELKIVAIA